MKKLFTLFSLLSFLCLGKAESFAQNCPMIVTPSNIQFGQTGTFAMQHVTGSTYQWIVSSGLSIDGSSTSSSCTVRNNNACTGTIRVVRRINRFVSCSEIFTNTANHPSCSPALPPAAPSNLGIIFNPCAQQIEIYVSPVAGATGYRYYIDGNLVHTGSSNSHIITWGTPANQWMGSPTFHQVCVSAYNSVGSSPQTCQYYNAYDF